VHDQAHPAAVTARLEAAQGLSAELRWFAEEARQREIITAAGKHGIGVMGIRVAGPGR